MIEIIKGLLTDPRTVLASIGLILATSSFISGLQLVKIKSRIERKIHRFNGYATFTIYVVLMVWHFVVKGFGFWALVLWLCGLGFLLLKIRIVRKRSKAIKYVSWMGATFILMWLYLVYIHIPV